MPLLQRGGLHAADDGLPTDVEPSAVLLPLHRRHARRGRRRLGRRVHSTVRGEGHRPQRLLRQERSFRLPTRVAVAVNISCWWFLGAVATLSLGSGGCVVINSSCEE